jgi:hypothetical protein
MMPMALAFLYGIRKLLSLLIVPEETALATVVPVDALKGLGLTERVSRNQPRGTSGGLPLLSGRVPRTAESRIEAENARNNPR